MSNVLAQGHNAMTPVRLEPAALRSQVKHSTTEPLRSLSSLSERVVVDGHGCHTALHFGVKAKENQDRVPTL